MIRVVTSKCKRCGKPISTSGAGKQLAEICAACITPAERHEILTVQGEAIHNLIKRNQL